MRRRVTSHAAGHGMPHVARSGTLLKLRERPLGTRAQAGGRCRRTVMGFLTEKEIAELMPSELLPHATPIPTQIVSSDEYTPPPQSEKQKEVEARLLELGDELGGKQGLSRRSFFQTAAGMAAGFVALNETFGPVFDVTRAEAATPAMAQERANAL